MFYNYGNFYSPFMMNNLFVPQIFRPNIFNFPTVSQNKSLFSFLFDNNSSIKAGNNPASEVKGEVASTIDAKRTVGKEEEKSKNIRHADVKKVKEKSRPDFLKRVKQISKNLNCSYKDLLAVMNSESGLNSKAVNPHGGATGLIQFMPKTAESLGTTTEKLKNMSAVEQLDYVEKYLKQSKKAAGFNDNKKLDSGDLYALIFLPARAERDVLTTKNEIYYSWNKVLDINKDGRITKDELSQRAAKHSYVA